MLLPIVSCWMYLRREYHSTAQEREFQSSASREWEEFKKATPRDEGEEVDEITGLMEKRSANYDVNASKLNKDYDHDVKRSYSASCFLNDNERERFLKFSDEMDEELGYDADSSVNEDIEFDSEIPPETKIQMIRQDSDEESEPCLEKASFKKIHKIIQNFLSDPKRTDCIQLISEQFFTECHMGDSSEDYTKLRNHLIESIEKSLIDFVKRKRRRTLIEERKHYVWSNRFKVTFRLPEYSEDDRLKKYKAMVRLSEEFQSVARIHTQLIVSELGIPDNYRTFVPNFKIGGIAGGKKVILFFSLFVFTPPFFLI